MSSDRILCTSLNLPTAFPRYPACLRGQDLAMIVLAWSPGIAGGYGMNATRAEIVAASEPTIQASGGTLHVAPDGVAIHEAAP